MGAGLAAAAVTGARGAIAGPVARGFSAVVVAGFVGAGAGALDANVFTAFCSICCCALAGDGLADDADVAAAGRTAIGAAGRGAATTGAGARGATGMGAGLAARCACAAEVSLW